MHPGWIAQTARKATTMSEAERAQRAERARQAERAARTAADLVAEILAAPSYPQLSPANAS